MHRLAAYRPPNYLKAAAGAGRLAVALPTHIVELATVPTPILPWKLPLKYLPESVEVLIKRDDMTGSTLGGNKVRKLQHIFGAAFLEHGEALGFAITCGGFQSNHARATAIAAAELGLESHLVLRGTIEDAERSAGAGNALLGALAGAGFTVIPKRERFATDILPRMQRRAAELQEAFGKKSVIIPVGGSDSTGLWGYLDAWGEMVEQQPDLVAGVTDLVVTVGSGGTAAGLAIGNYLTGSPVKIHAISVSDDADYFYGHLDEMLEAIGLAGETSAREILNVVDGYKGDGYGLSGSEQHEVMYEVGHATGVVLDPVYTAKAVLGMSAELKKQFGPGSTGKGPFRGQKVMFVHTGGVFGAMDGRLEPRSWAPYNLGAVGGPEDW